MIAPTYSRMAEEYKGRVAFTKVNINHNYETSQSCGIRSMPTFHFYQNAKLVHVFSGADTQQLRRTANMLAEKAAAGGTFAGQEVGASRPVRASHRRLSHQTLHPPPGAFPRPRGGGKPRATRAR